MRFLPTYHRTTNLLPYSSILLVSLLAGCSSSTSPMSDGAASAGPIRANVESIVPTAEHCIEILKTPIAIQIPLATDRTTLLKQIDFAHCKNQERRRQIRARLLAEHVGREPFRHGITVVGGSFNAQNILAHMSDELRRASVIMAIESGATGIGLLAGYPITIQSWETVFSGRSGYAEPSDFRLLHPSVDTFATAESLARTKIINEFLLDVPVINCRVTGIRKIEATAEGAPSQKTLAGRCTLEPSSDEVTGESFEFESNGIIMSAGMGAPRKLPDEAIAPEARAALTTPEAPRLLNELGYFAHYFSEKNRLKQGMSLAGQSVAIAGSGVGALVVVASMFDCIADRDRPSKVILFANRADIEASLELPFFAPVEAEYRKFIDGKPTPLEIVEGSGRNIRVELPGDMAEGRLFTVTPRSGASPIARKVDLLITSLGYDFDYSELLPGGKPEFLPLFDRVQFKSIHGEAVEATVPIALQWGGAPLFITGAQMYASQQLIRPGDRARFDAGREAQRAALGGKDSREWPDGVLGHQGSVTSRFGQTASQRFVF